MDRLSAGSSHLQTAERVLSDADLAWAITRAMLAQPNPRAAPGCWPLAEWAALSGLNAAFRAAMAPQPVCVRLRPGWQKRVRGGALARLRPRLAALDLPPGDEAATEAVLAPAFRQRKAHHLHILRGLCLDATSGPAFAASANDFGALRTLTLVAPGAASAPAPGWAAEGWSRRSPPRIAPGSPAQALALAGAPRERFCSAWLAGLPNLLELRLDGYELAELAHLPRGLAVLELSASRVCYDNAVCLPPGVRPAVLAVPNGSGGHWRG
ncbi:hypothetical protein WJX81_005027 [Elliptochloris bilobata]|uniref:Leucine-rich repeat domain-containing protein n=1 Tax=Elliptochloris bilobata TaxID=381761 RepID=A0AAW1RCQ6_9CHLO